MVSERLFITRWRRNCCSTVRLHPDKTKVVYCQDGKRRLDCELTAFTFLGFTFRARPARTTHGKMFVSFQPAISKDAQKKISGQIRRWRLHRRIGHTFADIARQINPVARGWMQYYGAFYRSALKPLLSRINAYLMVHVVIVVGEFGRSVRVS